MCLLVTSYGVRLEALERLWRLVLLAFEVVLLGFEACFEACFRVIFVYYYMYIYKNIYIYVKLTSAFS